MLILMVFEFLILDHLGPRKVDFSDFGPHTGKFYLVIFSKNQKFVQKWPKWGLFCSEFCTDYCAVVCLGLARTTYAKIAKNRRKIGQNSLFVTRFSPNWDRNRENCTDNFSAYSWWWLTSFQFDSTSYGVFRKVSFLEVSILTFDIE